MPKTRSESLETKNKILNGDYERSESLDRLPPPNEAREFVKNRFRVLNKDHRLILVEELGDYRVFIEFPGKKSEFDFIVWRHSKALSPELKIPTHVDLGEMFLELKKENLGELVTNSIFRLVRERQGMREIMKNFEELEERLKRKVTVFLSTLKWIALQEDVNYPPPYLGSKYTLAVYVLLNNGFELKDIRRMLKF
ncbi:MAG: hypothetical protein QFX37_01685 [Archaeoglobales archaeon]|nr:hypothetical protein [Archaeoglobales archaeon]